MLAVLRPVCLLLLIACPYGSAADTVADKLISELGCNRPSGPDTDKCVATRLTDLLNLGRLYLVTVAKTKYGGVGTEDNVTGIHFGAQTNGPFSVSGSGITVIGLGTTHVKKAKLDGNNVNMTLAIPKLEVKGDFEVKFPPLKLKFGIEMKIVDLDVVAMASFGSSQPPVVESVKVDMTAENMNVLITNNDLLKKMMSHWVNDNKMLNSKTLPWLSKMLGRQLKKALQKYVSKLK